MSNKSSSALRAEAANLERQADAKDQAAKDGDCGCEVAAAVAGNVARVGASAAVFGLTGVWIG